MFGVHALLYSNNDFEIILLNLNLPDRRGKGIGTTLQ